MSGHWGRRRRAATAIKRARWGQRRPDRKERRAGGTTWSIDLYCSPDPHQITAGIQDSTDAHFDDMPRSRAGCGRDNPVLRHLLWKTQAIRCAG